MAGPIISVVMPVYNREGFVEAAVESILSQSFSDFEFIIVDDHSQDATAEIIKSFKDDRIRLFENQVKGNIPKLRNQGLQAARGQYIAIMDSDDVAMPERLLVEKQFLDANPEYGIVGSDTQSIGVSGEKRTMTYPKGNELIQYFTAFKCVFCNPTVMLRKAVLDQHQIAHRENCVVASDYALQVDLLPHTKFEILPDICLTYRFHRDNITNQTIGNKEKAAARQKIISAIHMRAAQNLGFCLTPEEMDLFVAYTGESNKPLPDRSQLERFKALLSKLKREQKDRFKEKNVEFVHQKMLERIERNYKVQADWGDRGGK